MSLLRDLWRKISCTTASKSEEEICVPPFEAYSQNIPNPQPSSRKRSDSLITQPGGLPRTRETVNESAGLDTDVVESFCYEQGRQPSWIDQRGGSINLVRGSFEGLVVEDLDGVDQVYAQQGYYVTPSMSSAEPLPVAPCAPEAPSLAPASVLLGRIPGGTSRRPKTPRPPEEEPQEVTSQLERRHSLRGVSFFPVAAERMVRAGQERGTREAVKAFCGTSEESIADIAGVTHMDRQGSGDVRASYSSLPLPPLSLPPRPRVRT